MTIAAKSGHIEVVRYLLNIGANPANQNQLVSLIVIVICII